MLVSLLENKNKVRKGGRENQKGGGKGGIS